MNHSYILVYIYAKLKNSIDHKVTSDISGKILVLTRIQMMIVNKIGHLPVLG